MGYISYMIKTNSPQKPQLHSSVLFHRASFVEHCKMLGTQHERSVSTTKIVRSTCRHVIDASTADCRSVLGLACPDQVDYFFFFSNNCIIYQRWVHAFILCMCVWMRRYACVLWKMLMVIRKKTCYWHAFKMNSLIMGLPRVSFVSLISWCHKITLLYITSCFTLKIIQGKVIG